jgi:hypothetical protein
MTGEGSEWRGRLVRLTALQRLSFLASRVAYHRADPHRVSRNGAGKQAAFGIRGWKVGYYYSSLTPEEASEKLGL